MVLILTYIVSEIPLFGKKIGETEDFKCCNIQCFIYVFRVLRIYIEVKISKKIIHIAKSLDDVGQVKFDRELR